MINLIWHLYISPFLARCHEKCVRLAGSRIFSLSREALGPLQQMPTDTWCPRDDYFPYHRNFQRERCLPDLGFRLRIDQGLFVQYMGKNGDEFFA